MIAYTPLLDPQPFAHRAYGDRSDVELLSFVFQPGEMFSQKRTDYPERIFRQSHQLTPSEALAYDALYDTRFNTLSGALMPLTPWQVAKRVWPASRAWRKPSTHGIMVAHGVRVLHALQTKGLARTTDDGYRWELT